jgi:hypothetical protein
MYKPNIPLASFCHTNASYDDSMMSNGLGIIEEKDKPEALKVFVISDNLIVLGTGATQYAQYHWPGEEKTIITEAQLQKDALQGKTSFEIQSIDEQLREAKKSMGFNILELAAILQVSRPTIYGWMESKKLKLRKKNQERLNTLNEIGKVWKEKRLGPLGGYLHKPLGDSKAPLFVLLKSDLLDVDRICQYLNDIAQVVANKRRADQAHEALLRKHDFEPLSKEDMEDRLNDIDFMD